MRKISTLAVALFLTLGVLAGLSQATTPDEAIKKVMKAAMKGGLQKTVASGKGTESQQKELLGMFVDLAKATPPKGSKASWDQKTKALVDATSGVVKGNADATKALAKAAICKSCHDAHKGE